MKPWRIVLLSLCIAIGASAGWLREHGKRWLDHLLRERLNEVIDRATEAGYRFRVDTVDTDAMEGDLVLTNVRLDIDSALMDSLRDGRYRYLFTASVARIRLRGISYWRLALRHEFRVRLLEVDAPELHYLVRGERVGLKEPFARLSGGGAPATGVLRTDTLAVRRAACTVRDISERLPPMRIAGLGITVTALELKAQQATRGLRVEAAGVALTLDSLQAGLATGYRLQLGPVRLENGGHEGLIEGLDLIPPATAPGAPTATTITTLHIDRIRLRGIDLDRLIGDSGLELSALEVDGMRIEAVLDRTLPDPLPQAMRLPGAAVLGLSLPVRIDTLRVHRAAVHYRERAPSGRWGEIPFTALSATFHGITNEPGRERTKGITGTLACTILDTAQLNAAYHAELDGSDGFTFEAHVRDLPFTALNGLTRPLLQLQVDAGHLHDLRLNMKGDDRRARGAVRMTYDGLLVQVEPGTSSAQRHSMFGSILDDVLRSEHGGGLSDDRQRSVAVERDRDRSILTYIWHFTRAGLSRNLVPAAIERVEQVMRNEKEQRRAARALREQQRARAR